jgi:hypothetical protein
MLNKDQKCLDHAKHNFDACLHLNANGTFSDWVITTAYYSAIYYVCYTLFPEKYDINGKLIQCQSFHDYYKKLGEDKSDKHSVREDLVLEYLPDIYTEYSTLREMCTTARYHNYKMHPEQVKIAIESLDKIKSFCEPTILKKEV